MREAHVVTLQPLSCTQHTHSYTSLYLFCILFSSNFIPHFSANSSSAPLNYCRWEFVVEQIVMALSIGVCSRSSFDFVEVPFSKLSSWSNLSKGRVLYPVVSKNDRIEKRRLKYKCFASRGNVTRELDSEENASVSGSEEDLSHVIKFKMSDFKMHDRVSVGLGNRGGEVVYEATVKEASSPLFNTRVVLRLLLSAQAKRRGNRAIEVLKKLSRQRLLYHSYSMQVHGYVCSSTTDDNSSFILVHGYHGSSSLRHWLQQSDWLPTLEATLALDEESARKVGDDTVGGPAVSRQLRLIRILMRDLLIGVNYLHSHGLAHTELKIENLHISPVDKHIKVGILGNAADFHDYGPNDNKTENYVDRRKMMIAFDMRCVGFIMAKMVLRDLMDPLIFAKFKAFLSKGNDPSCLREFLMHLVGRNSSDNIGFQILDRNWGAGWNLLALLLATKPSQRISCLNALRHPFLCGPRWRVDPTMDMIRWSLGSTAVRITEEYIYGMQQRRKISHFIELMEMSNPHSKPRNWLELLPGKWRLLYNTGRHIGLTLRQPKTRVLIGDVHLKVTKLSKRHATFCLQSDIGFTVMQGQNWSHDKSGTAGKLESTSLSKLRAGKRLYVKEETTTRNRMSTSTPDVNDSILEKMSSKKWGKIIPMKEFPSSLPVAKLACADVDITLKLDEPLASDVTAAQNVVREVRMQVPPELFDPSKVVCGTYVDTRLLVLRSVNGSAMLFVRAVETC